ncbi:oxidoreductase [Nisaea nitritireducens]|uniref:oxidoreductase n=1 Tax=Nisaea nitritireducens TaxID=568392 RepID=UPI0018685CC3|nr:oxidoreductase [Nisaea nitritireducens]
MLDKPLHLPCGAVLKNRIAKAAMSDDLGDGCGSPTDAQQRLYGLWADGGTALSLVGEVQIGPWAPENYGNLVLNPLREPGRFRALSDAATANGTHFWAQLGHAGALAAPVAGPAKAPSALDVSGIHAIEMTSEEVEALPAAYAKAALNANSAGFTGVEIHAAHGFLLNQFLSPLFNRRADRWGGSPERRAVLLLEIIAAVRAAVGSGFPVAVKINATDQLAGGIEEPEALDLVAMLDETAIDLIDISGGAYFPGAAAASDGTRAGPYFLDFARAARERTGKPLMTAGGFKKKAEAEEAVSSGAVDMVGLARALALDPGLPDKWLSESGEEAVFPRFSSTPSGGVTAWYTQRLHEWGSNGTVEQERSVEDALAQVERRKAANAVLWQKQFQTEL